METIEITSLSSRGQIVIPQGIREKMKLYEGEKFVVHGEGGTIVLKKLEAPSFEGFDALLKKTRKFAKKKDITINDVDKAVQRARSK